MADSENNKVVKGQSSAASANQLTRKASTPPPPPRDTMMTTKLLPRASTSHQRPPKSPSSGPASLQTVTGAASSNIIPLPKSHIHRTPSELQLADDMRRAEYEDVRMYARLVVGMQNQIQRECLVNGGVVHPLSQKSLQGVLKTKQANDEELMTMHDHQHHHLSSEWGLSDCIEEHDENSMEEKMSSSQSHRETGTGQQAAMDAPSQKFYLASMCDDDDADADPVFNLEL